MKRLTLLLLFATLFRLTSNGQCPNGPVLLTTQAQVNAFPSTYPGCDYLNVRFEVKGAGITDLTPLSQLTGSSKNFYINFNPDLTSLSGLDNLTEILGDFTIQANHQLTNLNGLEGLVTVDKLLKVENNDGLQTLDGLTAGGVLTHVTSLVIIENDNLTDLGSALDNLQTIDEYILFNKNTVLPTINTMNNLTSIGWYLSVEDNAALETLNAFSSLEEVGLVGATWDFEINKHPNLTTLNDFVSLSHVGKEFGVSNNSSLTEMSFPSLTAVDGPMAIAANISLTSLLGLGDFTLGGTLTITGNTSLPECEADGICNYLDGPGAAVISNNAPGCNSVVQVEAACLLLPVELVYFKGSKDDGGVLLNWRTASEKNNAYFQIEHSNDGIHFQSLGRIDGAGNSAAIRNYAFRDLNPFGADNYYRLKQVDFDGKFAYSNIVQIKVARSIDVELYPNPTTGYVKLKGNLEAGTARLTDINGRLIAEKQLPDSYWMDLTREPEGVYFIEIQTESERLVKRVVKQ